MEYTIAVWDVAGEPRDGTWCVSGFGGLVILIVVEFFLLIAMILAISTIVAGGGRRRVRHSHADTAKLQVLLNLGV